MRDRSGLFPFSFLALIAHNRYGLDMHGRGLEFACLNTKTTGGRNSIQYIRFSEKMMLRVDSAIAARLLDH